MKQHYKEVYEEWRKQCTEESVCTELAAMEQDESKMEDAFYRELVFGTGGLRGLLGAGTNRMNCYTVGKATQGLAAYLLNKKTAENRVAISYDSRHQSKEFALLTAGILAANGIVAYLYPQLMPTPCLSFAVRELGCDAGVMITASHNPAAYNGYKVYGPDGCQITAQAAEEIQKQIGRVDPFRDVRKPDKMEKLCGPEGTARQATGWIRIIPDTVITSYLEQVKAQSVWNAEGTKLRIVYTPLHGSGLVPVCRVLAESGFYNLTVAEAQREPDGDFPTCPCPNPEMPEALSLGIAEAQQREAHLVLATDPDCDRVGAAVRGKEGTYELLSGNEMGLLLLEYLCKRRTELGNLPEKPVFAKTIVTTELARRIAAAYGVETVDVLTGFKYIGEQIGRLEHCGRATDFLFGFEDSFGYLAGTYVRDKDGVLGAMLISEMAAYYLEQGSDLLQELCRIYETYGYCLDTLHAYERNGSTGMKQIQQSMERLREEGAQWENAVFQDYSKGISELPKADVLKWTLTDGSTIVVRPSGTEPKLKVYLSVHAADREKAAKREQELLEKMEAVIFAGDS